MPWLSKEDTLSLRLPLTDPRVISLVHTLEMDFLLGLYESQPAWTMDYLTFLYEGIGWKDPESNGAFFLETLFTNPRGSFYINGDIILRKNKDFLVGMYSYQNNKHGYVWGHETRAKMKF